MSLTGTSHIKKGTVCQDSHKVAQLTNGWTVAAVADGVGSSKHSDIASRLAVDTVIELCNSRIDKFTRLSEVKDIVKNAYSEAQQRIAEYAYAHDDELSDYDTTLHMVVYDGNGFVYGHAGDGGIVGLTNDGRYIKVTTPQKAEDNICVIPLRAGEDSWVIGEEKGKYASVLLATDGVYDKFYPYLLQFQKHEPYVYVSLIRYFMDNYLLRVSEDNIGEIEKSRKDFLESANCDSITDDKTVVVIINQNVIPKLQDDSYYEEPDWGELDLAWRKMAYPHLYPQDIEYTGIRADQYILEGKPIAVGKTCKIYSVKGDTASIAQIYDEKFATEELAVKLTRMMKRAPSRRVMPYVIWPQDLLFDSNKKFAGVLFPKCSAKESLREVYEIGSKINVTLTWKSKIEIAISLCEVISAIHDAGYIVGNLNPESILVDPDKTKIYLADSDSILIQKEKSEWDMGLPEYMPVEIHNAIRQEHTGIVSAPQYTLESDNFALAVIIFKVLMNGAHPFACRIVNLQSDVDCPQPTDNIIEGYFPYVMKKNDFDIPMYAPHISILPEDIQRLFYRVFVEGHTRPSNRPTPDEWTKSLYKLLKYLKTCNANKLHYYYRGLVKCPWCDFEGSNSQNKK